MKKKDVVRLMEMRNDYIKEYPNSVTSAFVMGMNKIINEATSIVLEKMKSKQK